MPRSRYNTRYNTNLKKRPKSKYKSSRNTRKKNKVLFSRSLSKTFNEKRGVSRERCFGSTNYVGYKGKSKHKSNRTGKESGNRLYKERGQNLRDKNRRRSGSLYRSRKQFEYLNPYQHQQNNKNHRVNDTLEQKYPNVNLSDYGYNISNISSSRYKSLRTAIENKGIHNTKKRMKYLLSKSKEYSEIQKKLINDIQWIDKYEKKTEMRKRLRERSLSRMSVRRFRNSKRKRSKVKK